MTPRKQKAKGSKRDDPKRQGAGFKPGQRVQVQGYGEGTVIAVEARRGGRYSDLWIQPDEHPEQEIGVRYQHDLVDPA